MDVAVRAGLWPSNSTAAFDFSAAYAPDALDSPGWVDRRSWHLYNKVAPSLHLQSESGPPLPFSVQPGAPLTLDAVKAMTRDHFEGSPYDLSVGPASGPFNTPTRYDRTRDPQYLGGFMERAISLHRTTYAFVATARPNLPQPLSGLVWFAHHSPHSSLFVPLYSATQRLHESWTTGTLFDLRQSNAWWAFASVSNSVERMYVHLMKEVTQWQRTYEEAGARRVREMDAQLKGTAASSPSAVLPALTAHTVNATEAAVLLWWRLLDVLTLKYRDGQVLTSLTIPIASEPLFYPVWSHHPLHHT